MAVYRYPPEVHEFVKRWAPELRDEELAEACNKELGTAFTKSGMKAFRGNHGYKNLKKQWTSGEYWKYQKRWPQGMFEFIRDNSWGVSSARMAEIVNAKFGTNFSAHRMRTFRAKYHIRSGETGWFQKGHSPGNKGHRQSEYCSEEALAKSRAHQYKKGHVPANLLPVGTETIDSNGYRIVKVSESGTQWERWKHVHRMVWEEHNGSIPKGHMLIFKDGDKMNCDISNLMLISKAELATMAKKGFIKLTDPEMKEAGLNVVRLIQKQVKRKKDAP